MKRRIFAANWKMNKTIEETKQFLEEFSRLLPLSDAEIWIAPPYTAIASAAHCIREKNLKILLGAQNVAEEPHGAFTGEVSAAMVKDAGAHFCIIGHSERRTIYQENNAMIKAKIDQALAQGLQPLLCVGESKQEREQGRVEEVLKTQLTAALKGLTEKDTAHLSIAYEPIWAIGTGQAATPELAQEAHSILRVFLSDRWGSEAAQKIPLLYGGSVTSDNVGSLLQKSDINGALIGKASLQPQQFAQLITCGKSS